MLEIDMTHIGGFKTNFAGLPVNKLECNRSLFNRGA